MTIEAKQVATMPLEEYPDRPYGETDAGHAERLAGRRDWQVTLADYKRRAAYEYIAGGERRKHLLSLGLGTLDDRIAAHKTSVQQAVREGLPVPCVVLEDYKYEPWAQEMLA